MRVDLQIHSCLSHCGNRECTPKKIAFTAKEKGLDIIALTDHNTADSCPAICDVVKKIPGLTAYYGTEVTSIEKIHLLCLFGEVNTAVNFGTFVKNHLPDKNNNNEYFDEQLVLDAEENIIAFENALLGKSTDLSIDLITKKVHAEGGIVIASHIDREVNSIFSQLNSWPVDIKIDAADLSIDSGDESTWRNLIPKEIPIVRTSDAHLLNEIGRQITEIDIKTSDFESFKTAINLNNSF